MKKFLLLLALCGVMVACGDNKKDNTSKDATSVCDDKKDNTPNDVVADICNKLVAAAKAGNEAEFRTLWDAQVKMFDNANDKQKKEMMAASKKWAQENPEGMQIINEARRELNL